MCSFFVLLFLKEKTLTLTLTLFLNPFVPSVGAGGGRPEKVTRETERERERRVKKERKKGHNSVKGKSRVNKWTGKGWIHREDAHFILSLYLQEGDSNRNTLSATERERERERRRG